jgi:hypothetical protein
LKEKELFQPVEQASCIIDARDNVYVIYQGEFTGHQLRQFDFKHLIMFIQRRINGSCGLDR